MNKKKFLVALLLLLLLSCTKKTILETTGRTAITAGAGDGTTDPGSPTAIPTQDTVLKTEASFGKYGLVIVYNDTGGIDHEFKITKKELDALQASPQGIPPGLKQDEWETGHAIVVGKDFDVGDTQVIDGILFIKYAEELVNNQYIESFATFPHGTWSGTPPIVTVNTTSLAVANNATDKEEAIVLTKKIVAINNGVLTYEK